MMLINYISLVRLARYDANIIDLPEVEMLDSRLENDSEFICDLESGQLRLIRDGDNDWFMVNKMPWNNRSSIRGAVRIEIRTTARSMNHEALYM